jgi:hypothetical protein
LPVPAEAIGAKTRFHTTKAPGKPLDHHGQGKALICLRLTN